MRDEHDDRLYQALRQDLGRDIARLVKSIAYALERLHARLYDAPWSRKDEVARQRCKGGYTVI